MPPTLRSGQTNSSGSGPSSDITSNPSNRMGFVPIPAAKSNDGAIKRIENLLESIVNSLADGVALVIPYHTRNVRNVPATSQRNQAPQTSCQVLMFPARSLQELKKFEALFRLLEMVHEALLSGNLITKRNIYYQNLELFTSQSMVDDMVDNLAFTLGVGRDDLNIVATAKGLLAGPIDIKTRDGSIINYGNPADTGILLPSINSVEAIDFHSAHWLLIIEKEATFRTLVASEYHLNSKAGSGILVTAKGFPDLATRRFLHVLQSVRAQLPLFALVDFDPHGISIFRTYQVGSRRLDHEEAATVPRLRWLGIRGEDIMPYIHSVQTRSTAGSQSSESQQSQESTAYSFDELDDGPDIRPRKKPKMQQPQDTSGSIVALTSSDRKRAVNLMKEIEASLGEETMDDFDTAKDQLAELQKMLMLNIKAEIQAVDSFGDVTCWLNQRLCSELRI